MPKTVFMHLLGNETKRGNRFILLKGHAVSDYKPSATGSNLFGDDLFL